MDKLAQTENKNYYKYEPSQSPKLLRIGLVSGAIVYSLFAVLDVYALPLTYPKAWFIRFVVIVPAAALLYALSYTRVYYTWQKGWPLLVIIAAQLGLAAIMFVSLPNEFGYRNYYAGMILVILWGGIIFRLQNNQMVTIILATVIIYNFIAILHQRLLFSPVLSEDYFYFLNNNFILVSASVFALIGSNLLNRYSQMLSHQNDLLEIEKQSLAEAKKRAEASDKLKSAFLTNMSHEIRTPMNAIIGFSDLLSRPQISSDKQEQYSRIIKNKSKQLLQLINDIIDLSKIEADQVVFEKNPVELIPLMERLITVYNRLLEQADKADLIELKLDIRDCDEIGAVLLDETRFAQIMNNLVSNAVKFTESGSITIGCQKHEGLEVLFYVQDTGTGISKDKHTLIFERFRQSDESITRTYGGTGLGLSIVKNIVEKLNGRVWVESIQGKGATFYFTLPCEPVTFMQSNQHVHAMEQVDYHWEDKTILIAEDEDDNFWLLSEILMPSGIKITHATDGFTALEYFMENEYDLVLLDIKMPRMDGIEAAKKMLAMGKKTPIIAQTAYAMAEEKHKALKNGFSGYLTKPLNEKQVYSTLSRYLD